MMIFTPLERDPVVTVMPERRETLGGLSGRAYRGAITAKQPSFEPTPVEQGSVWGHIHARGRQYAAMLKNAKHNWAL